MSGIKVETYEHVVSNGQEVDYTIDLQDKVLHLKTGLSPKQYVQVGLRVAKAIADDDRTHLLFVTENPANR